MVDDVIRTESVIASDAGTVYVRRGGEGKLSLGLAEGNQPDGHPRVLLRLESKQRGAIIAAMGGFDAKAVTDLRGRLSNAMVALRKISELNIGWARDIAKEALTVDEEWEWVQGRMKGP